MDMQVGLLYIHDPQYSPQQHEELAKKLSANFGDEYVMGVFKLRAAGHHQGDLLLVHEERQEQCMGDDLAEAPEGQVGVCKQRSGFLRFAGLLCVETRPPSQGLIVCMCSHCIIMQLSLMLLPYQPATVCKVA